jgi:ATP-dependent Lon protease
MPKQISIPIAGQRQVYDVEVVRKALAALEPNENPSLRRTYDHMIEQGGERWLIKPSSTAAFDWLYEVCPNFSPVLDDLRKSLHLALFGNGPIAFMPVLLTGEPGVGKTHFAKCLADALATEYSFVNMASMTAGWILSGAAPSWKGAKEGKVARSLVHGSVANPLFLLDELDKARGSSDFDAAAPLYELMESETSASFRDEFLDVELDCSAMLWIATANYPDRIDNAILKRMAVYEVKAPTPEQGRSIGQAIYGKLIKEHGWAFDASLSEEALSVLESIEPREMKKRLLDAMGTARVNERAYLTRADFETQAVKQPKRPIGF